MRSSFTARTFNRRTMRSRALRTQDPCAFRFFGGGTRVPARQARGSRDHTAVCPPVRAVPPVDYKSFKCRPARGLSRMVNARLVPWPFPLFSSFSRHTAIFAQTPRAGPRLPPQFAVAQLRSAPSSPEAACSRRILLTLPSAKSCHRARVGPEARTTTLQGRIDLQGSERRCAIVRSPFFSETPTTCWPSCALPNLSPVPTIRGSHLFVKTGQCAAPRPKTFRVLTTACTIFKIKGPSGDRGTTEVLNARDRDCMTSSVATMISRGARPYPRP